MLVFGHIGITLGTAVLLDRALPSRRFSRTTGNEAIKSHSSVSQVTASPSTLLGYKTSWLVSLGSRIDIRLLLVGSLLSDIIDKPIGLFFFQDTIGNGRIIGHTLLFLILITLVGLYLYQSRGKTSLFALSFGTFTHLIFDQMWRAPRTLFWPIYGFIFDQMWRAPRTLFWPLDEFTSDRTVTTDWIPDMLHTLLTEPQVYIPEVVGTAIIVWFTLALVRNQKVCYFLKCGRVQ